MAAKKDNSPRASQGPTLLARLSGLFGQRGQSTAVLVLLVAMVLFWFAVWWRVRDRVLASPEYWLTQANVEITPPPPWIRSDIRAEVFRDASLGPSLSIMDDNLTARLHDAFSLHPWIAKVRQVRKSYPAHVQVDLIYRKPVCMVLAVPSGAWPVDVDGVRLPTADFCPLDVNRYPRLTQIDSTPVGPEGTRWGDPRVVGGAQIAAALEPAWQELKLDHIAPTGTTEPGRPADYFYELVTRSGTRILWGRAPGTDMPGEVPAADKVARLKKYVAENGSLEGRRGPQELDVRSLRSMEAARR